MDTYETEFVDISGNNVVKIGIKNEPIEDNDLGNQKCGDIFLFDGRHFTFSCYFCSTLFTEYEMFTNHILEEHLKVLLYDESEQELEFEATVDETQAKDVSDDNSLEHCENLLLAIEEAPTTETQRSSDSKTSWLQCDCCTQRFRTELGLARHKKNQYHKNKTNASGDTKNLIKNSSKNNKQISKKHECNLCDFFTYRAHDLKVHQRIHTGELPFQCETCKKRFRFQHQLTRHVYTHTNTRPYICSYCPSAFSHPTNLKVHIRRKHLDEKPHKCDLCEKTFVTTTERIGHMRLHTDEKPYQCEECGNKFRLAAQLNTHKRVRHSDERNFGCKECGKKFKTNDKLKYHMIIHSDEKPYECKTCNATFPRRNALVAHEKLHVNFKQYACKICGKKFAQSAGLYSHMKSHKIDNELKV